MNIANNTEYITIGSRVFSPILIANIQWLAEKVIDNNYDMVCFGARDGYIVKQAFDDYFSQRGGVQNFL